MSARAGRLVMSGSSNAIRERQMTAVTNDRRLRESGIYILDGDRRASMGKMCESTIPRLTAKSPLSGNSGTYSYVRQMSRGQGSPSDLEVHFALQELLDSTTYLAVGYGIARFRPG